MRTFQGPRPKGLSEPRPRASAKRSSLRSRSKGLGQGPQRASALGLGTWKKADRAAGLETPATEPQDNRR